jgi:large subunit ribosomal protein L12e
MYTLRARGAAPRRGLPARRPRPRRRLLRGCRGRRRGRRARRGSPCVACAHFGVLRPVLSVRPPPSPLSPLPHPHKSQSPKKVGEDIQKATLKWKGLKITVKLTVVNRVATVELVPTASSMVVKALNEPDRDRKKGPKGVKHNGNITLKQVYEIARDMRFKSLAKEFSGTVKEILGTAQSVGCTVDGKPPHDIIEAIDAGDVDVPEK